MDMLKKIVRKCFVIYWQKKTTMRSTQGINIWADEVFSDYIMKKSSFFNLYNIHRKGYTYSDWTAMGLNRDNYKRYLSNAEYYAMHPINGRYSVWIDDKLILKYLCAGTELDRYMPRYYFLIDNAGNMHKLMDFKGDSGICTDVIIMYLKAKGALAVKKIAGSIGEGFYCFKYEAKSGYSINGVSMTEGQLREKIMQLRDYIITEYLVPHEELAAFSEGVVNCIRYLSGNINGSPVWIKGFIRFGTKNSGYVENYNAGGILCYLDQNGQFREGNILKNGRNTVITEHVDSGCPLEGTIPLWNEIRDAVSVFCQYFPMLKYLGFDFVVTKTNEVKILEINSLTSLDVLELRESIYDTEAKRFYEHVKTETRSIR